MSLYGQVKRVPTNTFQFDRVYPNRKAMETASNTDGVYIGRYVLVEYGIRYEQDSNSSDPNAIQETQEYRENRLIDQGEFHGTYDSTVWQKIYAGTQGEKYIMIAELNALAPQIDSHIVNPLEYSRAGEQDATEDIFYVIKQEVNGKQVPVAAVPITKIKETMVDPSFNLSQSNELAYTLDMPASIQFSVDDTLNYNKEGFDYAYSVPLDINDINNFICWSPVGIENNVTVNADETSAEYTSSETKQVEEKKLYFNVPAFGNLMKDLYDLMYGQPIEEDTGEGKTYIRPYFKKAHDEAGDYLNSPRTINNDDKEWLANVPTLGELLANNTEGLAGILSHLFSDRDPLTGKIRYYLQTSWDEYFDPDRNVPFIDHKPEVIGYEFLKENGLNDFSPCDYSIDYNSWSIVTPLRKILGTVLKVNSVTEDVANSAIINSNQALINLQTVDDTITVKGEYELIRTHSLNAENSEDKHKWVALDIDTGIESIIGFKINNVELTSDDVNYALETADLGNGHIFYWVNLEELQQSEDEITLVISNDGYLDKTLKIKFENTVNNNG